MKVFNYYKTCNNNKDLQNNTKLYFEDLSNVKLIKYRGFIISKHFLIKDNIIISERVTQKESNIDILLDGGVPEGKLYHMQTRPLEALRKAKELLIKNNIDL